VNEVKHEIEKNKKGRDWYSNEGYRNSFTKATGGVFLFTTLACFKANLNF